VDSIVVIVDTDDEDGGCCFVCVCVCVPNWKIKRRKPMKLVCLSSSVPLTGNQLAVVVQQCGAQPAVTKV